MDNNDDPIARALTASFLMIVLSVCLPFLFKASPSINLQFNLQVNNQRIQAGE